MTVSVRQMVACHLSGPGPDSDLPTWSGDVSVLQDLAGAAESPPPLSLLALARRLTQKQVDLNLIRVGSECFTDDDETEISGALAILRFIYTQVDLGIGRVYDFSIPVAEAGGWEIITGVKEAEALAAKWTFPNHAVDVFLVLEFEGDDVGASDVEGRCDKSITLRMTGCVIELEDSTSLTGQTLAHELGHYLGLTHFDQDNNPLFLNNLMFGKVLNGGQLEAWQGEKMKRHCFVKTRCRVPMSVPMTGEDRPEPEGWR